MHGSQLNKSATNCDEQLRIFVRVLDHLVKQMVMRNVKRYIKLASIDDFGLLVIRKPDQYLYQRELIVVSKDILPGILHAMHLYFSHCAEAQLLKVFQRYFYCIGSEAVKKKL